MNDYYVFDGENATTGEVNRNNGKMSNFGFVLKFRSKQDAVNYVNHYRGFGLCVAGTRQKMRGYCLGMSVRNFEEHLLMIDYEK